MERGATIADLASEFLARKSGSAETGIIVVVVPTPTDPTGIGTCARDLRTWSAEKKYTDEERGGRHDPGVRRPGAGRGQMPARTKIFRAACLVFGFFYFTTISRFSYKFSPPTGYQGEPYHLYPGTSESSGSMSLGQSEAS